MKVRTASTRWAIVGFLAGVFLTVWSVKLWTIGRYGSDLPYWDQWAKEGELFYQPWFEHREFWSRVFVPHNEHRIAPTLALNLGLVRLGHDRWDARVQCAASAALHAGLITGLAWWAFRRLTRRGAFVVSATLVAIAAPPIAWENVLGGFQSQFYFLATFSLLALGGMLGAHPKSWRWWGGLAAAAAACVSMGSGMLIAVPILVVCGLQLIKGAAPDKAIATTPNPVAVRLETYSGRFITLAAALAIGVVGWLFRAKAEWHAPLHAHSGTGWLVYVARCLAWPAYGFPAWTLLAWLPWAWLLIRRLRQRSSEAHRATDFVLAGGLWVIAQAAAVAYSRAGGSELPAPRYGDICALGLAFNAFALAILTESPKWTVNRRWAAVAFVAVAWNLAVALALCSATRDVIEKALPAKKAESVEFERNVADFVLTDDYTTFEKQRIPFPLPDWLARMIRNPTLRRLLPTSVRQPVPVSGLANEAAPAPPLPHRATRTVTQGEWTSSPLAGGRGWWMIETSGAIGTAGTTLELRSPDGKRSLGTIMPSKAPGTTWRAAYVNAPREPAVLVARTDSPEHWIALSEPVEMSALSYGTWRLTQNAWWLCLVGLAGVIGCGAVVRRASRRESSPAA